MQPSQLRGRFEPGNGRDGCSSAWWKKLLRTTGPPANHYMRISVSCGDSSDPHGPTDAEPIMAIGRAAIATALLSAALASLGALAGCSSSSATGWDFETPPATGSTVAGADVGLAARPVLVISPFANPASSS